MVYSKTGIQLGYNYRSTRLELVRGAMEESKTYICRTCSSMFFSPSEIVEHKAMTGHREYSERKSRSNSSAA